MRSQRSLRLSNYHPRSTARVKQGQPSSETRLKGHDRQARANRAGGAIHSLAEPDSRKELVPIGCMQPASYEVAATGLWSCVGAPTRSA